MGYANDAREAVVHLANILKDTDSSKTVGQLKDYITYSKECKHLREFMYDADPDVHIVPDTALYVVTTDDAELIMETATVMQGLFPVARLDKAALEELDIQDDADVLGWYYDNYMK
jgi:hypothetical protein